VNTQGNVDAAETARFSELAASWWDPNGPSRPLHLMNPVRLAFVRARAELHGARVLDVGCGAGLLCEAMARSGAEVTGIDAAPRMLQVARLHALSSDLQIDYQHAHAEQWREAHAGGYDVVTCMELIEHVPDPASLVRACAGLVRPGGQVFFSTINRTPRAWLLAVVAAEYLLRMLPMGTHEYQRLVRPSELAQWARAGGLSLTDLSGIHFNPLSERFRLARDPAVNYVAAFAAPGDG
jgi:2-polyprenyl-6-hydroxyphenyl methylase/3-demethylubiquinone-9 3-methyltransferase